jgi:hypothetical protein
MATETCRSNAYISLDTVEIKLRYALVRGTLDARWSLILILETGDCDTGECSRSDLSYRLFLILSIVNSIRI